MFHYFSSIVVTNPKAGKTAIGVQFSGYGSRATALVKDRVYFTVGRIVKSTKEGGYQCFFESNLSLYIGGTAQYRKTDPVHPDVDLGSELLGKVLVFGFGTIIKTERVASVGLNNTPQTDLHVTMRHYDYHNVVCFLLIVDFLAQSNRVTSPDTNPFPFAEEVQHQVLHGLHCPWEPSAWKYFRILHRGYRSVDDWQYHRIQ
jgi:hypothetical protein